MQPITINHIKYEIPLGWDEVNFYQATQVIKNVNDKGKQLEALSGIENWMIDKFTDFQVSKLFALISFTENLEVFNSVDVKEEYKNFDFGSIEYGKAEYCRKAMIESDSGFESVILIMQKLINKDISKEPFLEWIGTANFFLSKSISSMIAIPNLAKMESAKNKSKLVLSDFMNLEALERTLNLQDQTLSETQ